MEPPSPWPKSAARSLPAASSTVATSSIHSSRVGTWPSGTGSDSPLPRLSKTITRLNAASRWKNRAMVGSSHMTSTLVHQSGMNTRSSAPAPSSCQATCWPPLLTA